MKTLTMVDIISILGTSNCPNCHKFIIVKTSQTDNIFTTSGHCKNCNKTYMIDRSNTNEILSGHEYDKNDR